MWCSCTRDDGRPRRREDLGPSSRYRSLGVLRHKTLVLVYICSPRLESSTLRSECKVHLEENTSLSAKTSSALLRCADVPHKPAIPYLARAVIDGTPPDNGGGYSRDGRNGRAMIYLKGDYKPPHVLTVGPRQLRHHVTRVQTSDPEC